MAKSLQDLRSDPERRHGERRRTDGPHAGVNRRSAIERRTGERRHTAAQESERRRGERRRAALKAHTNAARLAATQDALGLVTWIWAPELVEPQWLGDLSPLLGMPPDTFSGRAADYFGALHPDDAEAAKLTLKAALRAGQPAWRTEVRAIWPDGSVHWLEIHVRARYRGARAIELAGLMRDVSETKERELALRQSEEKFARAFRNSPDYLVIKRFDDGVILEVNPAFEAATGFSAADAIGRTPLELGLWHDPDERAAILRTLRDQGVVRSRRTAMRARDGTLLPTILTVSQIDLGAQRAIVCAFRDVTELDAALARARESSDKYRAVFDTSPDAIAITRLDDGRVIEANEAGLRTLNMAREQVIGASAAAPDIWADPAERQTLIARLKNERVITGAFARLMRSDGVPVEVSLSCARIELDGIPCAVWSWRDLTESRRSERLLVNVARGVSSSLGDEFFRSLVSQLVTQLGADHAFVGELVPEDPGRVRSLAYWAEGRIAPNFEYRLGHTPTMQALSRRGTVMYADRVAELFPQDVELARIGARGYVGTALFAADGAALGIVVVITRRPLEPGPWLAPVLEIFGARAGAEIERGRAEEAARQLNIELERRVLERTAEITAANLEMESFTYSISHDLRAPVRAVVSFAELLVQRHGPALPPEGLRLLSRVDENARRMRQLIDDLLEFSRTGKLSLRPEEIDMRELVVQVVEELAADASPRPAIMIGDLPPARGDASLLRQVWSNLVGNAIKFSSKAERPRVEIGGRRLDGGLEYSVSDNGAGFDMAYVDKLFGVFQRLHSHDEFAGSGVGLAIVQRIVEKHGGRVRAESDTGRGATFRFSLPA